MINSNSKCLNIEEKFGQGDVNDVTKYCIFGFFFLLFSVGNSERQTGSLKEHKLAFTPNNTIFKSLVDRVTTQLKLQDAVGVSDANALQDIIANYGLIAGIEFHHPNVSVR